MRLKALLAGVVLFHSSLTFAAWREASSAHFVLYAEESESDLFQFAMKLELFHQAMTVMFPAQQATPSPSNRPTLYAIGNKRQMRKITGSDDASLAAFYVPRAGGAIAYIPPLDASREAPISESERTMTQAYALHFKADNLNFMTPPWFTTGFGEYFANFGFTANSDVILGAPNTRLANELTDDHIRQISIEELLDNATHEANRGKMLYDSFSLRSWALFHYLYSNQAGKEKMSDYLNRLNRGESELDAARAAFGDLATLDQTLEEYVRKPMPAWRIANAQLRLAPVTIRELSNAEAAALEVRMQSDRGLKPEETERAAEIAQEARELAAKYADAPDAWGVLAKAEYDAGNDEAAIAAADKALALNPNHMNALIQKGEALARVATASKSPDDWAKVRTHFIAVNKLEPDHPIPMLYFYLSYKEQGLEPTQNAIDGLEWALQLAPYDSDLRMTTAQAQMDQKRYQDAVQTLSVLAFNPRDSDAAEALTLLEAARKALAEQPDVEEAATNVSP